MNKTIEQLASELLHSPANNGFGIKCEAIIKVCEENRIEFKELWTEIIKQGNQEEN